MVTELVAGVDEVGRGPLAGPVVAAAVILGNEMIPGLDDSKKKTARQREQLFDRIHATATAIGIGFAEVDEIDRLNIHHASLLAMRRAVLQLAPAPSSILVDGKFCPEVACPARAIVGGDGSEPAISAASIIAKVTRDQLMVELEHDHPGYGFAKHKGYPTSVHLDALARLGASSIHRRSYAPVKRALADSDHLA